MLKAGILAVVQLGSRALARAERRLSGTARPSEKGTPPREQCPQLSGECPRKLHFGCGYDKRDGYLNVDMDPNCRPDLVVVNADYSAVPRNYFTEVLAMDVLEHVPRARTLDLLLDFADYLVDHGKVLIQTTSILHAAVKIQSSKDYVSLHGRTGWMFGNQQHPADFHYTGFTDRTLQTHLMAAGFTVEKMELRQGWLLYVEATKTSDWTSMLESARDLSDKEFVSRAFREVLCFEPSESDVTHWARALGKERTRKQLLKELFSAPERLFITAERFKDRIPCKYTVDHAATLHNDSRVQTIGDTAGALPLSVETDPRMWSYAISFALDPLSMIERPDQLFIAVDVEVEEGSIGIGCADVECSSYIDGQVYVSAGARCKVCVAVGRPLAAHHLLVRNVSPCGRSVARIYGIELQREETLPRPPAIDLC